MTRFPGEMYAGDCLDFLDSCKDKSFQLIVTSPPYNLGKRYETPMALKDYLSWQEKVIDLCIKKLKDNGSICWQVGHFIEGKNMAHPLDWLLKDFFITRGMQVRNRIIWHFEHGLHCTRRFSGRHETICWFTKTKGDDYVFNLDPVRVPQKYPGKTHYHGPNYGKPACNPLGKNPGDHWDIPNVKSLHCEKTAHPCQFPIGLVMRLILALTNEGDWVCDPFAGVGTTQVAAILTGRHGVGSDLDPGYCRIAEKRMADALAGTLVYRPMNQPIFVMTGDSKLLKKPWEESIK